MEMNVLVVDIFAPKQNRAILMIRSSGEKLFKILPWVLSVKTKKPVTAMSRQHTRLIPVEACVTALNLETGKC